MRVIFALFTVLASSLVFAQEAPPPYQAGKHYHEIATPVRTSNPDKIELTEVFWYGCGHCHTFAPHIAEWESQAPDDVVVTHSPAIWREVMETHARIYYTAKALGKLDELHMVISTLCIKKVSDWRAKMKSLQYLPSMVSRKKNSAKHSIPSA